MTEEGDFFNKKLSEEERTLYDRQFRLKGWRQDILKESRVLIAGVGGLGCEIAKNLAMVGVQHMDLVDMDTIEYSNLNRQILFADARMGEPKAEAAARKLKVINANLEIIGHHCSLERLDPILYKQADVIVGGLDSVKARRNLNAQAIRFNKPLVDGGVSGYHGHVYTTFPGKNACYECYPTPIPEVDDMNACTVVGVPRKRNHCLLKANMAFKDQFKKDANPKNIEDIEYIQKIANDLVRAHNFPPEFSKTEIYKLIDRHEPGLITINTVIASLQSHETIKILNWVKGNTSLGEPNMMYTIYNGMTMRFYNLEKPRNENCAQCGPHVRRAEMPIMADVMAKKIVEALSSQGYELDPEMDPTITYMDFDGIKEVDLDQTLRANKLRSYELLTVVGFKDGPIYLTIIL